MHLVHADDVDIARAQMYQHLAQELGRHLEMMVGLKRTVTDRPDMVQCKDGADPRQDWPQQGVGAAEIERT